MNPHVTRSKTRQETLQEIKARLKSQLNKVSTTDILVEDVYAKAEESFSVVRKKTGICFDDKMTLHKCEWDPNYPENPERYTAIMKRCEELRLFEKCTLLSYEKAAKEIILTQHDKENYEILEHMDTSNLEDMEKEASNYDAIYFNKHTFECASIATGCVLSVLENVCDGTVQNGMAIVRPPGHHAMPSEYCGYCFFNNVAIAAKHALTNNWAKKILIVDFDVHHGQATQQMFYEDNRVLYFSIHRYEHGNFWPCLRESNLDFIGGRSGTGYNINVPLNAIGLNDIDYLAIVFHILLPVAYEYNPDLVIFSAGYDACLGCPEGEMDITPGFYGHLMSLLGGLADGKLVVCLEGGYFPPSLAEGVAMTIRGLLDEAPALLDTSHTIHYSVIEVINSLKIVLHSHWKCFRALPLLSKVGDVRENYQEVDIKFGGLPLDAPFETRNCYLVKDSVSLERDTFRIKELKIKYSRIKDGPTLCYAYDDVMLEHTCEECHQECPSRLERLHEMFCSIKLNERCHKVESRKATIDDLRLIHDEEYVNSLISKSYEPKNTDIYFNDKSVDSILTATGSLLSVVDSVLTGPYRCGAAFIRPPGHHAEHDEAQGFCFISNVAVAAKYILKNKLAEKILILDFDIHHGNGTQNAFYNTNDVLYISIHKYENGKFYPGKPDANFDRGGTGAGVGHNVNIPFNDKKMNDIDYIYVFHQLVLPIAYAFNPDVILVSAGFDAGVKDIIGNYNISPEAFGHFIQLLKGLAMGKLILALEGGYNVTTLAYSMNMCIKALLGDPLPRLNFSLHKATMATYITIQTVMSFQREYWPILKVDKKLVGMSHITTKMEELKTS